MTDTITTEVAPVPVPTLGTIRRAALALGAPLVLSTMAQMMMRPSRQVIARHDIPPSVIAEAYSDNSGHWAEALASMAKLRRLWADLGPTGPPYRALWRALGLWDDANGRRLSVPGAC
ncbi:MAG: hypothetical protein NVS3B21_30640 [Acidimicrobiales bacterium]